MVEEIKGNRKCRIGITFTQKSRKQVEGSTQTGQICWIENGNINKT
jgi:hypothetical protein